MKKNVASQVVGAQIIAKADGTPITTGAVTAYVTGDGGTQAQGSVSSGACTHEGQGFWTYAPAQAETNYDHVAFTFVHTDGVNATVQIYTSYPQTGDGFARLGVPAGASVSADIDALPTAAEVWAAGTRTLTALDEDTTTLDLDATIRAAVGLASANLDTQLDALPTASENGTAVWAAGTRTLTAIDEDNTTLDLDATIRAAVGLASANLDTQLDALPTAAENADAVWDEALAGHAGAGSAGEALSAAGTVGDPWTTALPGAYSSGQAGFIIGTNLNATVSSRATQTSVDDLPTNAELATALGTADDAVLTQLGFVRAVTDLLATMIEAGAGSPTYYRYKAEALEEAPSGSGPTAPDIAAAVWDEALAGHLSAGSTGEKLNDAASAGNPWSSIIEGSYTAEDLLRVLAAVAAGKTSIVTSSGVVVTFRNITDTGDMVVADMSGSERTGVTITP